MKHMLELPTYLDQDEAVKDRFERMKQRPVALEVKGLGKTFEYCRRNGNRIKGYKF